MKKIFAIFTASLYIIFLANLACLNSYASCPLGCRPTKEHPCAIDCPPGKFAWGGAIQTKEMICRDCPAGYYCPGGTLDCTDGAGKNPCNNGAEYQDQIGQSGTKDCPRDANAAVIGYMKITNGAMECNPVHDTISGCTAIFPKNPDINTFVSGIISHGTIVEYYSQYDPVAQAYRANNMTLVPYDPTNQIIVTKCDPGYYLAPRNGTNNCNGINMESISRNTFSAFVNEVCVPCPADRPFSPAGSDELGDCGHILHYGAHKVYLHSEIKTNPSFRSLIGGAQFYGNMKCTNQSPSSWTFSGDDATKPHLWTKVNGKDCLIYDDSTQFQ